jgi:dTMP kinase
MSTTGCFIVLEGGEASGKTTQAALLSERIDARLTREPGDTELGRRLRALLLEPGEAPIEPRAEALLMAADRAQHVSEVVRPTLAQGRHVVCDRFTGSTLAYQGYGRGLDLTELASVSRWAADQLEPDLVVLLDISEGAARARQGGAPDRFEAAGSEFHERVREGYRQLAVAHPERWAVVAASGSVPEVAQTVWQAVESRLGLESVRR